MATHQAPRRLADDLRPRVVVGWRENATLKASRLEAHKDTHDELRRISNDVLQYLGQCETRAYQPFAALDSDEAMLIDTSSADLNEFDTAALIDVIDNSHKLQKLAPKNIAGRYLFYAIVWSAPPHTNPAITVIRKQNPRVGIQTGMFSYSDTLRSVTAPDFALDDHADIVVDGDVVYLLNENNGRLLLNDVGLAYQGVRTNVTSLVNILGGPGAMTTDAEAAFVAVANRKVNVARRIARLPTFFSGTTIDKTKLASAAVERCDNHEEIIEPDGTLCVSEARVVEALDLIEGRLYQDPITDEERVAERVSRRTRR